MWKEPTVKHKDDAHHVERADGEAKEGDGGAKHPLHVAPVPPEPRVQQPAPPRVRPVARPALSACPPPRAVTARVQGRLLSAADARGPRWTRRSAFLLFVALLRVRGGRVKARGPRGGVQQQQRVQSAQDQQRVPQADAVKERGEGERQHDGEGPPAERHEGVDEPQTSVEVVAEDDQRLRQREGEARAHQSPEGQVQQHGVADEGAAEGSHEGQEAADQGHLPLIFGSVLFHTNKSAHEFGAGVQRTTKRYLFMPKTHASTANWVQDSQPQKSSERTIWI